MIERTYDRFIYVCNKSGIRGLGLEKRIFETQNFFNVLNEVNCKYGIFHEMDWLISDVKKIHEFFKLTEKCSLGSVKFKYLEHIIKVNNKIDIDKAAVIAILLVILGKEGEILNDVQNRNRLHLIVIKSIPLLEKHIGFAESWIEDNELFFKDMKKALEELFHFEKQTGDKIPWVGNDMREFELFNTNSFSQLKKVFRGTSQHKDFRFMN